MTIPGSRPSPGWGGECPGSARGAGGSHRTGVAGLDNSKMCFHEISMIFNVFIGFADTPSCIGQLWLVIMNQGLGHSPRWCAECPGSARSAEGSPRCGVAGLENSKNMFFMKFRCFSLFSIGFAYIPSCIGAIMVGGSTIKNNQKTCLCCSTRGRGCGGRTAQTRGNQSAARSRILKISIFSAIPGPPLSRPDFGTRYHVENTKKYKK